MCRQIRWKPQNASVQQTQRGAWPDLLGDSIISRDPAFMSDVTVRHAVCSAKQICHEQMSVDILFPITHLKCNDRGIDRCTGMWLIWARFGTAACKRISAWKGKGGAGWWCEGGREGGGWNSMRGRKGERERDYSYITASLHLLYCIILEVRGGGAQG